MVFQLYDSVLIIMKSVGKKELYEAWERKCLQHAKKMYEAVSTQLNVFIF